DHVARLASRRRLDASVELDAERKRSARGGVRGREHGGEEQQTRHSHDTSRGYGDRPRIRSSACPYNTASADPPAGASGSSSRAFTSSASASARRPSFCSASPWL